MTLSKGRLYLLGLRFNGPSVIHTKKKNVWMMVAKK